MTKFLDIVVSQPWALLKERAEEYKAIIDGDGDLSPQALEAYRARSAPRGERLTVRDGVGILKAEGPLFKRANLMVEFCGATSYEIMRRDLQAALDDAAIHSIALVVDSPGGEANGCDELANAIYAARSVKPITAFVSGMAASGGYWMAAAAQRVVVSDLAVLGSIGVVLGVQDRTASDERRGVRTIEFVSSQSPGKRPDVNTDAGRRQIQNMVDDLAKVFIAAVAKFRGVSAEDVVTKFGAGGVKIGANAVAAGMADAVGSLEAVITSLRKKHNTITSTKTHKEIAMTTTHANSTGIETERARMIITSKEAVGHHALAVAIATETNISPSVATSLLRAAAEDRRNPTRKVVSDAASQAGWKKAVDNANASIGAK